MMDRQDIQKLLGGYATGTLTPEEQQALFEAALGDQELFDALAREQSLRDLLRDPAARAQLLSAIDDPPLPWYRRFWRPVAIAAAAAACLMVAGVFISTQKPQPPAAQAPLVAEMRSAQPLAAEPAIVAPPQAPATPLLDRPARRALPALKKEAAEPIPARAKPAVALGAMAKDEAPAQVEQSAAAGALTAPAAPPPPPPQPVAAPMAAPPLRALDALQAGSAGAQSSFRDTGNKSIPLQNAQALFYASPQLLDSASQAQQFFAPQQQQQQGLQQNKQQQDKKEASQRQQQAEALKTYASLMAPRTAHLGVKWTILRQREGDDFVEVEAGQLRAGDSVKLKITPNDGGYLSVWDGATALVQAVRVERMTPFQTPVITAGQAGQKVLIVQLTRNAPQTGLVRNAVDQQGATDSIEHATYVVSANVSQVAPVLVNITLTFK